MDNLNPIRSFFQDLITPIVTEAVKSAMPKVETQTKGDYLTIEEAIKQYCLSSSTIYRRFENGTLTRVKSGGRTLLKRSEVEGLMKECKLCAIDERGRGKKATK